MAAAWISQTSALYSNDAKADDVKPKTWAVSNSSPVYVFEPLFWTGQLLGTLRLKAQGHYLIDRFLMPIHTSCRLRDVVFTMMLFGCTRAICELKDIYDVLLKVLIYRSIDVGQ